MKKEVQKKTGLHVAEHPVGLDDLVEDFENRCQLEEGKHKAKIFGIFGKHKAKIVGIFGMGGLGKTTLAKKLYNRKKLNYDRVSFLFDVRETSVKSKLHSLQRQLLKDLFDEEPAFKSTEEGMSYLKDHLGIAVSVAESKIVAGYISLFPLSSSATASLCDSSALQSS